MSEPHCDTTGSNHLVNVSCGLSRLYQLIVLQWCGTAPPALSVSVLKTNQTTFLFLCTSAPLHLCASAALRLRASTPLSFAFCLLLPASYLLSAFVFWLLPSGSCLCLHLPSAFCLCRPLPPPCLLPSASFLLPCLLPLESCLLPTYVLLDCFAWQVKVSMVGSCSIIQ